MRYFTIGCTHQNTTTHSTSENSESLHYHGINKDSNSPTARAPVLRGGAARHVSAHETAVVPPFPLDLRGKWKRMRNSTDTDAQCARTETLRGAQHIDRCIIAAAIAKSRQAGVGHMLTTAVAILSASRQLLACDSGGDSWGSLVCRLPSLYVSSGLPVSLLSLHKESPFSPRPQPP